MLHLPPHQAGKQARSGGRGARGAVSPACRGLALGTPERGRPGQGSQVRQVRGGPEEGEEEEEEGGDLGKERGRRGGKEDFARISKSPGKSLPGPERRIQLCL